MKALLFILFLALLPFTSFGAKHLLSLKTAANQEAQLMGDVTEDDHFVIENPVLKVKGKTYRLGTSESTPALNELICRKVGSQHRYAYAKTKKRDKSEALEADRNLGLRKSKSKMIVRAFHCVEEE